MIWMTKALSYMGEKEIKGIKNNSKIVSMWERIKAPFRDDETPWCAAFVGSVLEECGIKSTRKANARSYQYYGNPITKPEYGCIVVLWRESKTSAKGHVGFLLGVTPQGDPVVLGGNQGDCVSSKVFPKHRVLCYRLPKGFVATNKDVPILKNYKLSTSEA